MQKKKEIEDIIRKWALKNAYDYGSAEVGAVVGKIIAEIPDVKFQLKKLMPKIKEEIEKINRMKEEEIKKAMQRYEYPEKEEKKKRIELPNAEGKVITRFAPAPNGYPHIGHAKAAFLSYEGAKAYKGSMFLRFDDTNPEESKQEYVDVFLENLLWLGINWKKDSFTSDSIGVLYDYAIKLIRKGGAYVCRCTPERIKLDRRARRECPCRNRPVIQNVRDFGRMIDGEFEEGTAILRFKGDMRSFNTVMRDPTLFRIIKKPHYRQKDKFAVWPSYDFAAPILDSIDGITHAIRSKEYELRDELYNDILTVLELRKPIIVSIARLEIENNPTQKRIIRKLIEEKKVKDWDDPRLMTITGLRRRGVLPEAIKNFVLSFGIAKSESKPTIEGLLVENRKLLDPTAKRYHFVRNPYKLEIKGLAGKFERKATIPYHPTKDLGTRTTKVSGSIFVDETDAKAMEKDEILRLIDLCNIKVLKKDKKNKKIIAEEVRVKKYPEKKIQWVSDGIKATIIRPADLMKAGKFNPKSLQKDTGICEAECKKIKDREIIQFVRYGFVRLDNKKEMSFIFSC